MKTALLAIALLASTVSGFGVNAPVGSLGENREASPVWLTASNLSNATGQPSLVLMSNGSMQIPVWSLSGGTVGQSVAGLAGGLPNDCTAVKVEIVVTTNDPATSANFEDVYRVHLSQMVENSPFTARYQLGNPVRTALPAAPGQSS